MNSNIKNNLNPNETVLMNFRSSTGHEIVASDYRIISAKRKEIKSLPLKNMTMSEEKPIKNMGAIVIISLLALLTNPLLLVVALPAAFFLYRSATLKVTSGGEIMIIKSNKITIDKLKGIIMQKQIGI